MAYSFEELNPGQEVKQSSGFEPLVPPTETLANGSLQITDFIKGVGLKSFTFDDEKKQVIFEFEKDGKSTRKYLSDPDEIPYIQDLEEGPAKDKAKNNILLEIQNTLSSFIYRQEIFRIVQGLGAFEFPQYAQALVNLVDSGKARTKGEVWLKMTFKSTQGEKPLFIVPRYAYIGNENYRPLWGKKTDEGPAQPSNESAGYGYTNFAFVKEDADFSTNTGTPAVGIVPPSVSNGALPFDTPTLNLM